MTRLKDLHINLDNPQLCTSNEFKCDGNKTYKFVLRWNDKKISWKECQCLNGYAANSWSNSCRTRLQNFWLDVVTFKENYWTFIWCYRKLVSNIFSLKCNQNIIKQGWYKYWHYSELVWMGTRPTVIWFLSYHLRMTLKNAMKPFINHLHRFNNSGLSFWKVDWYAHEYKLLYSF